MRGSVRHLGAYVGQPAHVILKRLVRSPWVPFEVRARLLWREREHRWVAHRPDTFNGKVRWRMLKDRRPILTTFADKVAAREHVTRLVGTECLTTCHAIVADARELDRARLPREFVAKASHGSGGVWIVSDSAPAQDVIEPGVQYAQDGLTPHSGWNRIITSPDRLEWDVLVAACEDWLSRRYLRIPSWAYRDIPPRILVEELLSGPDGRIPPNDHRFFVFDGVVRLVQMDTGAFGDRRSNLYLPDWTPVHVRYDDPRTDQESPCPPSLERMIELAQLLGQGIDFVRVDLYDIGSRVVFGELTNYPHGGGGRFQPDSYDAELGRHWILPSL